jgi:hypothetical protein
MNSAKTFVTLYDCRPCIESFTTIIVKLHLASLLQTWLASPLHHNFGMRAMLNLNSSCSVLQDPLQSLRILCLYRRFKTELKMLLESGNHSSEESSMPFQLEIKVEEPVAHCQLGSCALFRQNGTKMQSFVVSSHRNLVSPGNQKGNWAFAGS